jgi:hypothetical protein
LAVIKSGHGFGCLRNKYWMYIPRYLLGLINK